jgi:hypothetical protein
MAIKQKTLLRLRAAVALLALALGWISTPLSLASWEPDVCEMECCIAVGHCCCATRHAFVKGREPKPGDVSLSLETTLTDPCPAGCAVSGGYAKNKLLRASHAQAPHVMLSPVQLEHYLGPFLFDHQFAAQPFSPRAPPACDGHIA